MFNDIFYYIKLDIEKKYQIYNPMFEIKNQIIENENEVVAWVVRARKNEKWVKYKHIKNGIFALKEYFPCPPEDLCEKKSW